MRRLPVLFGLVVLLSTVTAATLIWVKSANASPCEEDCTAFTDACWGTDTGSCPFCVWKPSPLFPPTLNCPADPQVRWTKVLVRGVDSGSQNVTTTPVPCRRVLACTNSSYFNWSDCMGSLGCSATGIGACLECLYSPSTVLYFPHCTPAGCSEGS